MDDPASSRVKVQARDTKAGHAIHVFLCPEYEIVPIRLLFSIRAAEIRHHVDASENQYKSWNAEMVFLAKLDRLYVAGYIHLENAILHQCYIPPDSDIANVARAARVSANTRPSNR